MMSCCTDTSDRISDRCFTWFPCLSDPARRSTLCLQLTLAMLHLVFVGFICIFVDQFINKLKTRPWYVIDAMRDLAKADASLKPPKVPKQLGESKNGSVVVRLVENQEGEHINTMKWTELALEMYPHGTSVSFYLFFRMCTCSYCNIVQAVHTWRNSFMHLDWRMVY